MAFLSLLVFSVAVMGFLFFYRPAVLLIENKKKEAVDYFFKTLGAFGAITAIVVAAMLTIQ
jgi:Na+-transporting methylmalonyl-CoA/oxaloacetate decarboxylase gamma subunit